jgi:hypothetical protein
MIIKKFISFDEKKSNLFPNFTLRNYLYKYASKFARIFILLQIFIIMNER